VTKRFYKTAAAIALDGGGHGVALDGRPIRTPAGRMFSVPVSALALAVAAEWAAQDSVVKPLTMPLMRLCATAIDRIGDARDGIVAQIAAFGASDLLSYWAEAPADLVVRQTERWQPLLDWVAARYGARLVVTAGIVPVEQDAATLRALHDAVDSLDDFRLAALSQLTAACGSLVIALAATNRHIDAAATVAASQLDEIWQAEQWGEDEEAAERRAALAAEIESAIRFLALLEGPR